MSRTLIIAGHQFEMSEPYSEGHTLTENEAIALNQARAERVAGRVRKEVSEKLPKDAETIPQEILDLVAKADAEFVFPAKTERASRETDPVAVEARKIARKVLSDHLISKGLPVRPKTDEEKAQREAQIEKIMALDKIVALAKKNVKARENAAVDAIESILNDADAEGEAETA